MTVPFWCLFVACLLPYVLAPIGGYFKAKQFGRIDNKQPRVQSAQLEGIGARANAAQSNAWEALPVFAAAVFTAHLAGADPELSATAAIVFITARVLHGAFYLSDLDKARSASFLFASGSSIWLFALAANA